MNLSGIWQATERLGEQSRASRRDYVPTGWRAAPVPGYFSEIAGLPATASRVLLRRLFTPDPELLTGQPCRLLLEGVATAAQVWCNGSFVGEEQGNLIRQTYELTRYLTPGENILLVEVAGLPAVGGILRGARLETVPLLDPERLLLRAVPRRMESTQAESAEVAFDFTYAAQTPAAATWVATVTPETFSGEPILLEGAVQVRKGWNRLFGKLTVPTPQLWWTWDRGRPDLYRFGLELHTAGGAVLRQERLFGIRSVELREWQFRLNRQKLFVRGAALGPAELRRAAPEPGRLRQDLELLLAAHLNTLWVRNPVPDPTLYEEASRRGILIWQEVPTALAGDGALPALLDQVGSWPAVAIWDCSAEAARSQSAALQSDDPDRPCLTGTAGGGVVHGDALTARLPAKARLVLDLGSPSFPSPALSRQLVTGRWPDLNLTALGAERLERELPLSMAQSLEQYEAASQAHQAFQVRMRLEQFRCRKYDPCCGVLLAGFIDGEPAVSEALVDYGREPKAGYAPAAAALRPVLIMAEWPHGGYAPGETLLLDVTAVNDTAAPLSGNWSWTVRRGDQTLAGGGEAVTLEPDGCQPMAKAVNWTIPEGLQPGPAELVLALDGSTMEPVSSRYGFDILLPS